MKKFFDSMSPEAIYVIAVILGALILGLPGIANAWRVHHNEMLPQERRQFLDL
jgi:hypothetical protein